MIWIMLVPAFCAGASVGLVATFMIYELTSERRNKK